MWAGDLSALLPCTERSTRSRKMGSLPEKFIETSEPGDAFIGWNVISVCGFQSLFSCRRLWSLPVPFCVPLRVEAGALCQHNFPSRLPCIVLSFYSQHTLPLTLWVNLATRLTVSQRGWNNEIIFLTLLQAPRGVVLTKAYNWIYLFNSIQQMHLLRLPFKKLK